MSGPLILADLPWLLYRAHFAMPSSITDGSGAPAGALLGTANALLAAGEACRPRAILACTGAEEAEHRVRAFPPYHAHRPPMPDELRAQWERAPALLQALGIAVPDGGALEADDLMGSYAQVESQAGGEALIFTADRDLFQAVDEHVGVLEIKGRDPARVIDAAEVRKRSGVPPALIPDLIALRGDPSDGIPGAPGIGAKTAADLLGRHGSLEAAIAASLRERPRVGSALREHADQLRMFKEIATLVQVDVERPADRALDAAGGARAARTLGLERLATRLERMARAASN
ncbi:MAG TPA: 5'-3' exonuclease H3TH domain-containing protein [Solirubrobacteraceae bacterium]|nr:5'-3' exonuclease H3TH domain-containing protein [Solirubrobacteraceae bacterium]